jgi:hypothetical protein
LAFGKQGPSNRSAQQIFVLVQAARAHHAPQIFRDELLAHVGHMNFGRAGLQRLLFEALQLVIALADVAAHGDHFALIVFLQPRNDDGCIEASRVGQRYLLGFHGH